VFPQNLDLGRRGGVVSMGIETCMVMKALMSQRNVPFDWLFFQDPGASSITGFDILHVEDLRFRTVVDNFVSCHDEGR
jgi:hypothetical protein